MNPPKSNVPEASVLQSEVSEGSVVINEPASIGSVEPVIVSDPGAIVHLAVAGAPVPNTEVVARVPSSLLQSVDKYCIATCEVPLERVVPGNNQ